MPLSCQRGWVVRSPQLLSPSRFSYRRADRFARLRGTICAAQSACRKTQRPGAFAPSAGCHRRRLARPAVSRTSPQRGSVAAAASRTRRPPLQPRWWRAKSGNGQVVCSADSRVPENHGLLRLFRRGSSTTFLRTDHDGRPDRARTMITVPKNNFRPLPHLVSLSAIGVTAVGIFVVIGFLLFTHPQPAMTSADPVPAAQTPEAHEVPPPGNNDAAQGSSPGLPADKVTASATPDTPSNRDVLAVHSTAMKTALIPSASVIHAKRPGVVRHHHNRIMVSPLPRTEDERSALGLLPTTERNRATRWRPDASAGPNPGGGFYDGPNINVGRINP